MTYNVRGKGFGRRELARAVTDGGDNGRRRPHRAEAREWRGGGDQGGGERQSKGEKQLDKFIKKKDSD